MKKEQILILELLNDPNYQINQDGSIFTCIDGGGHKTSIWRTVSTRRKFSYKRKQLPTARIIYYKFNKIIDESWLIRRRDGRSDNNQTTNLYCPKVDKEREILENKKTCRSCNKEKNLNDFNIKKKSNGNNAFLEKKCKNCQAEYSNSFYDNNKVKIIESRKTKKFNKMTIVKIFNPSNRISLTPSLKFNRDFKGKDRNKEYTCEVCESKFIKENNTHRKYCSIKCVNLSSFITHNKTLSLLTLTQLAEKFQTPANFIRSHARAEMIINKIKKECRECKTNFQVEACHLTPVSHFKGSDTLQEINGIHNLAYLCPNHHAVLDRPRNRLKEVADFRKHRGIKLIKRNIDNETIRSRTKLGKKSNKYESIRNHARTKIINSTLPIQCHICHFDQATEICHLKPIADFSPDALLSEVNDLSNLIILCPNHHWKLDSGNLAPEERESINSYIQRFKITQVP